MIKPMTACAAAIAIFQFQPASAAEPFTFKAHPDIVDMQAYVQQNLPVGTSRNAVRNTFVQQGGATLIERPGVRSTEKYIYDIDMCHYYLFRWNVSADYNQQDQLKQFYIQGEPVFANQESDSAIHPTDPNIKATILKLVRARPEAYKGDNQIYAQVIDWNPTDPANYNRDVFVGGPTRASIPNMGSIHVYHSKLWRSMVDESSPNRTVEYTADCKDLDAQLNGQRPPNVSKLIYDKLTQAVMKSRNLNTGAP